MTSAAHDPPRPSRRAPYVILPIAALAVVAVLAGAGAGARPASAQGPADPGGTALGVERGLPPPERPGLAGTELEAATEALASELRCPVCQGLSVAASPSESAQAMRAQVRQLLAEGYSEDQIVAYFERSYGEFVRLVPKARGFNLLVFVLPAAGLLIGALLVAGTLRRRAVERSAVQAPAAGTADPLDEYRERVRREVSG